MTRSSRALVRTNALAVGILLATVALGGTAQAATATGNGGGGAQHGVATAGPLTAPQPLSIADRNGTGANPGNLDGCGAYCSTRDGSASANGNGGGAAQGKPCAGCVGRADNKNPAGQYRDGSDHNNRYECDGNYGIGRGNPAHTGCTAAPVNPPVDPPCGAGDGAPVAGPMAPGCTPGTPTTPGTTDIGGTTGAQPVQQPDSGVAPAFVERPVVANGRVTPVALGGTGLADALAATGSSTGLLLNLAVALMMTGIVVLLGVRRRVG